MSETTAPVQSASPDTTAAPVAPELSPAAEGDAAAPDEATKEVVKEAIRKLKLKIDGQEQELPEDEVIRLAQLGKASHKRFEEAKKAFNEATTMRQQSEQFLAMLKADPKAVLSNPALGIDLRKFAEQIVWENIQEQSLTPEQKKARDTEAELNKYKQQEEKEKARKAEEQMETLRTKYAVDYDRKITQALQTSGLPKTPTTVKRMAEYMFQAVQNGYDLEPADLVDQVRKDYLDDIKSLFGNTEGDQLMGLLGEDVAKKIRAADLKRLKSTTGDVVKTPRPEGSAKPGPKPKKLSGVDWRESLMKEAMGR